MRVNLPIESQTKEELILLVKNLQKQVAKYEAAPPAEPLSPILHRIDGVALSRHFI